MNNPMIALLAFVALSASGASFKEDVLKPFDDARAMAPAYGAPTAEWAAQQQREWLALEASAHRLYEIYTAGKWTPALSAELHDWCPTQFTYCRKLSYALRTEFMNRSMDRLRQAKSPSIQALLKVGGKFNRVRIGSGGPAAGGFHRGKQFVFLDFLGIPPEEWLVILVHEMIHTTDAKVKEASLVSALGQKMYRDFQHNQKLSDPKSLPPGNLDYLKTWLMAGLDRGLLAEWRAWVPTLQIYQDGVAEGLWPRLGWIEEILSQRRPGESLERFCYRYLDERFTNPTGKMFSVPLVQKVLLELREELRAGKRPLDPKGVEKLLPFAK